MYEDNGEIYYSTSNDNGVTWSKDLRISDGNGNNFYPSIDVTNGIPVVVWQQENANFQKILLRRKISGSWENEREVYGFFGDPGYQATPVVSDGDTWFYKIVWQDPSTDKLKLCVFDGFYNNDFGDVVDVPNSNSASQNPAIATDSYGKLHLTWAESGSIYYSKLSYSTTAGGNETFTWEISKESVSAASGLTNNRYPSVTTDYSQRANISWQAYSQALYLDVIAHRRRENSGGGRAWGSVSLFASGEVDQFKPSISGFPNVTNNKKLRIAWRRSDNQLRIAKYAERVGARSARAATGLIPT